MIKKTFAVLAALLVGILAISSCSNPIEVQANGGPEIVERSAVSSEWQENVLYNVGDAVSYQGETYICRQSHTSYAPGWTPVACPALWALDVDGGNSGSVGIVEDWEPGITYITGQYVSYSESGAARSAAESDETVYVVVQSHTSMAGWVPPAVPALYAEAAPPAQPEVTFNAGIFSGHVTYGSGDQILHHNVQGYLYDDYDQHLIGDVTDSAVSGGQKVTVKGDLSFVETQYWNQASHMRVGVILSSGKRHYSGFEAINWSGDDASFSIDIDNIGASGTIDKAIIHFTERMTPLTMTNLAYTVSAGAYEPTSAGIPFPNRTTSLPKHSAPVYAASTNSAYSQVAIENDVQAMFEQWRSRYLKSANFGNAEGQVGKYVVYGGGVEHAVPGMKPITTSECHGWGMLILALMENGVNDTQADFDAMVDYYKQFRSATIGPIMDWQQSEALETKTYYDINWDVVDEDGKPTKGDPTSVTAGNLYVTPNDFNEGGDPIYGGFGGAADGDMDIAYALLLADKQWGSSGDHDYKALALELIAAIDKYYIAKAEDSYHVLIATWLQAGETPASSEDDYWVTRSSDLLMTHFEAFGRATGDGVWEQANRRAERFLDIQEETSTGLFPDFYARIDGQWVNPPGKVLETVNDGSYYWNSCRTPWRVFLSLTYDNRRQPLTPYDNVTNARKFNNFVAQEGGLAGLKTGYTMAGTAVANAWASENMAFAAPALIPSIYSGFSAQTKEAYWDHVKDDGNMTATVVADDNYAGYFGETIRMISAIAYSGNWINP